MANLGTSNF